MKPSPVRRCIAGIQFAFALLVPAAAALAPAAASAQSAPAPLAIVKPAIACADLATVDLAAIGAGARIRAAGETTSAGFAGCSVQGVLASGTRFAVLLPAATWTQRYLQLGCGILCAPVTLDPGAADGCTPLQAGGFVVATTLAEQANPASGLSARHRALSAARESHLTALAAKTLIRTFYGQPQAYAYFDGCSIGGPDALAEAERLADDFDGVLAGAAVLKPQAQNAAYRPGQARAD